jgi:hypothetical protein
MGFRQQRMCARAWDLVRYAPCCSVCRLAGVLYVESDLQPHANLSESAEPAF